MPWKAFKPGGRFVTGATLAKSDPWLAWAEATGFVNQQRRDHAGSASTVPAVVELRAGCTAKSLDDVLRRAGGGAVRPAYVTAPAARFCVADLTAAACAGAFAEPFGPCIERFEMSAATLPQRPAPRPRTGSRPARVVVARTMQSEGATSLLGVIDFGCAFANSRFRQGTSSHLLNIWDQDTSPAFGDAPAIGGMPPEFGYGREINREMIDGLLAACITPGSSSVDEDACYELARYPELRRRVTHGAHVLSQFVGPEGGHGRVGERVTGPSDDGGRTALDEIVFVQLPRDTWSDPSGGALAASLLDGLRYILACAGDSTRRVVVNISCAFYTGPHNGTSLIETATAGLVAEAAQRGIALRIVMPTGNSFDARWHAEAVIPAGQRNRVVVRVPPNNEVPTIVQVWMSKVHDAASLRVLPPSSSSRPSALMRVGDARTLASPTGATWATAIHTESSVRGMAEQSSARPGSLLMLFIEPTCTPDRPGADAPYGDWAIEVEAVGETAVRVYVARTEDDMGGPVRAHPSRIIDVGYDPTRFLQPALADAAPFPRIGPDERVPAIRCNTISGVATGSRIVAVAGYTLRPREKGSTYSSSGPHPNELSARAVPLFSAAADESRAMQGIRGAGTRSGSVVRLAGTSYASPQVARRLAAGDPKVKDRQPPADVGRMGWLRIDP